MEKAKKKENLPFLKIILSLLYILSITIIIYYLYQGLDFYLTALEDRPHHVDYFLLKPGAVRSHGFGMVGSTMMILLLLYSIRKRTSLLGHSGKMKDWLNFHIFLGINGPLYIILHSTLKLNGIVAVSFWSMIAVALSGIVGRYLYLQIPRTILGNELSLSDLGKLRQNMINEISEKFSLKISDLEKIEQDLSGRPITAQNLIGIFIYFVFRDITIKIKSYTHRNRIQKQYEIPKNQVKELIKMARQKAILEKRIQLWNRIQQLFHYWHVFHKPFAVIMYLIMFIHIGVSVWLGYTWLF